VSIFIVGVEELTGQKKFEPDTQFSSHDLDRNGIITDEELQREERILQIENADKMADSQRRMAWFALAGMLLYPFAVVFAMWLGLGQAATILGDMAATYFVSVAAIVASFYAKEAWVKKGDK
tara:strand:+ start:192 stop:557 length:366 start_codon:yes stop_codon:yes gene_type:complete